MRIGGSNEGSNKRDIHPATTKSKRFSEIPAANAMFIFLSKKTHKQESV